MSVQINVPLETLQRDAAVAGAVSALLEALGQRRGPGRPRMAAKAPAAAAPTRPGPRPRGRPAKATAGRPAAAAARAATAKPARVKKPRARRDRVSSPDAAKKLLDLIRERGTVTSAEALKILGLSDPRVIGGMVGSMNRWSTKQSGAPRIKVVANAGGEKTYTLT